MVQGAAKRRIATVEYEAQVMDRVQRVLDQRVTQWRDGGVSLPAVEDLAEAMLAGIPDAPAAVSYAALLGPFYSSTGARRVLQVPSKQALNDRRNRGTILAAQTSDGIWVYPAFQFDVRNHAVRPALVPLLHALKGAPRWGAALWFVTPHPELDGRTPLEASKRVADRAMLLRLAEQYAAAAHAA